jgi:chromosome segregation ATPase
LEKNKKIKDEIYDKYLKLKNIFDKNNEYNKLLDELKIILLEINLKLKDIDDIKKRLYNLELKYDMIKKEIDDIRKELLKSIWQV